MLARYDSSLLGNSFACTECQKFTYTKKNALGKVIEIVMPVAAVGGGAAGILGFFGVKDMDALVRALSGAGTPTGYAPTGGGAASGHHAPYAQTPYADQHGSVSPLNDHDRVRLTTYDPSSGTHSSYDWGASQCGGPDGRTAVPPASPPYDPGQPHQEVYMASTPAPHASGYPPPVTHPGQTGWAMPAWASPGPQSSYPTAPQIVPTSLQPHSPLSYGGQPYTWNPHFGGSPDPSLPQEEGYWDPHHHVVPPGAHIPVVEQVSWNGPPGDIESVGGIDQTNGPGGGTPPDNLC